MDIPCYNVILKSSDKSGGTNSAAEYNIYWPSVLPMEYSLYSVTFSFCSGGANLKDGDGYSGSSYTTYGLPNGLTKMYFGAANVFLDLEGKSFNYDTTRTGSSTYLGSIYRQTDTSTSMSASVLRCGTFDNPMKVVSRPTQHDLKVSLFFMDYPKMPFIDSNEIVGNFNSDAPNYTMCLSFQPILSSYQKT